MKENSMIHPKVTKLLQEIVSSFNEEEGRRAGEYPEVYLISLLEHIKDRLPEVSAMLYSTVEMARFGPNETGRFQKALALVQQSEKMQSRKIERRPLKRRHLEKVGA